MASDRRANPFSEGDIPEMMKKEILFWSHRLQVSPSKLFALTEEELDNRLRDIQEKAALDRRRRERNERLLKLSKTKRALIDASLAREANTNDADHRTIWQVLGQAAKEIQHNYMPHDFTNQDHIQLTRDKNSRILSNDDVSELNKKEILYWSQALQITPSTLLSLTQEELDAHLLGIQVKEQMEQHRQMRNNRIQKLVNLKKCFEEAAPVGDADERSRGGSDRRDIWEILAQAADEIERNYRPTTSAQVPPTRNYRLDRIHRSVMEPFSHSFQHQNNHNGEQTVITSNTPQRTNMPDTFNCAHYSPPTINSSAANNNVGHSAQLNPSPFDDEQPTTSNRIASQQFNTISASSSSRANRKDSSPDESRHLSTSIQPYRSEAETSD